MSTGSYPEPAAGASSPLHARHFPTGGSLPPGSGSEEAIDPELINDTRNQIRELVAEITRLAQSDCSKRDFWQGFLTRIVQALAAEGGAIWTRDDSRQPFTLAYQVNLSRTELAGNEDARIAHGQLLERIATAETPQLVAPGSGDRDSTDNPTACLLIVAPIVVEQQVVGLVEVFQRSGAGPTTQRGYLRFVVQMAALAGDFLRNEQLRRYSLHETMWNRMASFVHAIHGSLDIRKTVYAIANESPCVGKFFKAAAGKATRVLARSAGKVGDAIGAIKASRKALSAAKHADNIDEIANVAIAADIGRPARNTAKAPKCNRVSRCRPSGRHLIVRDEGAPDCRPGCLGWWEFTRCLASRCRSSFPSRIDQIPGPAATWASSQWPFLPIAQHRAPSC